MNGRKKLLLVLFSCWMCLNVSAQTIEEFSIQSLNAKTQEERLSAANQLKSILLDSLSHSTKEELFQKFNNFSVLESEDKKIRIFTWCVPLDQGFFEYFGIIQLLSPTSSLFILKDGFTDTDCGDDMTLDKDHWCGAFYSKIITNYNKNGNFYTLLGWDGGNAFTNVKVIDILWFDKNENPYFGKEVFDNAKHCKRILLQYKKAANCSLQYSKQSGIFNGKRITKNMIVFNRLAPENQYFEGVKSMYVPTEIYDAYFWKDNKWIFLENIDARNN